MTATPAGVERTADGHHIVVDGRRWRATDPSIPEDLRTVLVRRLMSARRAVGAAKRADDVAAVARARACVHDAKVALGERGEPWFGSRTDAGRDERIEATIRTLVREVTDGLDPDDVARALGGASSVDDRPAVDRVVVRLVDRGEIRELPATPGRFGPGPELVRLEGASAG